MSTTIRYHKVYSTLEVNNQAVHCPWQPSNTRCCTIRSVCGSFFFYQYCSVSQGKWRSCLLPRLGLPTGFALVGLARLHLCVSDSLCRDIGFSAHQTGTGNWAMKSFKLSPCNINPVASPQLGITKENIKDECSTVVLVNGLIGLIKLGWMDLRVPRTTVLQRVEIRLVVFPIADGKEQSPLPSQILI